MPLFEIETASHIIITWAENESAATKVVHESYPQEPPVRVTRRPARYVGHLEVGPGHQRRNGPVLDRPRLPVEGRRRQGSRHSPLHAAYRGRPGTLAEGHRIEHGDGLVGGNRS